MQRCDGEGGEYGGVGVGVGRGGRQKVNYGEGNVIIGMIIIR